MNHDFLRYANRLREDGLIIPGARNDANEAALFAQSLTYLYTQPLRTLFPGIVWRNLIPVKPGIPAGAEAIAVRQLSDFGTAKWITNPSDNVPQVGISAGTTASMIQTVANSYEYTVQEIAATQMSGFQIDAEKAVTARRLIETTIDAAAMLGVASLNFQGLANLSGITPVNNAVNWYGSPTVANIVDDLSNLYQLIATTTKGIFGNDLTLVLPSKAYAVLNSPKSLGAGSGYTTIASMLKQSTPWLKEIIASPRLDGAGASGKDRAVLYFKDPNVLSCVVPVDFEQLPPQARNFSFVVNCYSRFGGVQVNHPAAIRYLDIG